jgi:hypothetical protein
MLQVDDYPFLEPAHELPPIVEFTRAGTKRSKLAMFLERQRNLDI